MTPSGSSRGLPIWSVALLTATWSAVASLVGAQPSPSPGPSWADIPESRRDAATDPMNARSRVATVRQGLSAADPTGARAYEIDADSEALRGTFRLMIPLVDSPGRGEPFRFMLHYQARMWFGPEESTFAFLDGDVVNAPGWSLGLPKLLGGILIEADGTRRPARRTTVTALGAEEAEATYVTTDGSNITYHIQLSPPGTVPYSATAEVRYPDGSVTVMRGGAGLNAQGGTSVFNTRLYATEMIDRNANVTTVEYANFGTTYWWGGYAARPSRIVDPLGREVHFYYGSPVLVPIPGLTVLTAITASGPSIPERILARLTYRFIDAYWSIDATNPARDAVGQILGVKGIYFPATASGYWFGEADSYNRYGMIVRVREQAQMGHTAPSLTDEGTLTAGTTVRDRVYNFPATAPATGDRLAFPRYTTLTEAATGAAPVVTNYYVSEQPGGSQVVVTLPDSSKRETLLEPNGLPRSRSRLTADGTLIGQEAFTWTTGTDRVSRLAELTETDANGRTRRTEYTYLQGRLQDVKQRDWVDGAQIANAPLLRWTRYEYVNDPAYTQRGISGLVSRVDVYDGTSLLPEERTDYQHDGTPLRPMPGVDRNLFATPGFRPDLLALLPANAAARRGLVTLTKRWIVPQLFGNTSTIDTESHYTVAGLPAEVKVAGQKRLSFDYSAAGAYALPDTITEGAPVAGLTGTTAITRLTWDVPTGLLRTISAPGQGSRQFTYDHAGRLTDMKWSGRGTFSREFSPDSLRQTVTSTLAGGATAFVRELQFDGWGLPRRVLLTRTGYAPVETVFEYDTRGRLHRFAQGHAPGGTPQWAVFDYEPGGRVGTTTSPDGSASVADYRRTGIPTAVIATGTVRQEIDPWQRPKYVVTDALDRVVQVLEPLATAAQWVNTRYDYDARSNLVAIRSDANPGNGGRAARRFQYDGLSRLTHRALPERATTLDDAGHLATGASWSDFYAYDADSRLIRHVDARGVTTEYDYRGDPLGRLFAVRHFVPSTATPPVAPAPDVSLTYVTQGHTRLPQRVRVAGLVSETYHYDKYSRADDITTRFDAYPDQIVRRRLSRKPTGAIDVFSMSVASGGVLSWRYGEDPSGRRAGVQGVGAPGAASSWGVSAAFTPSGELLRLNYSAPSAFQAVEDLATDSVSRRLNHQTLTLNGTRVFDFSYDRNTAGATGVVGSTLTPAGPPWREEVFRVDDAVGNWSLEFSYDVLGRVRRAQSGPMFGGGFGATAANNTIAYDYRYDEAGNRTSSRALRFVPVAITPGAPIGDPPMADLGAALADGQPDVTVDATTNRVSLTGIDYDAAGNVTRLPRKDGSALLFQYDAAGRLSRAQREGSPEIETYAYDAYGRLLIAARPDGSRRVSVWHDPVTASSFDVAMGGKRLSHSETTVVLAGRPVVRLRGPLNAPTPFFTHHFPTGTLTSSPSAAASRLSPLPYGAERIPPPSSSFDRRFHSYERSAFGLDYAIHRFYDPEMGRFLQPDPMGERAYYLEDPQSLNAYAFARSDPVTRRDPLGLDSCSEEATTQVLPDGSIFCLFPQGKAVYETVVKGSSDAGEVLSEWLPQYAWWGGAVWDGVVGQDSDQNFQDVVDRELGRKLRELNEKRQKCGAARASFAAAATAYARVSVNVEMHNEQIASLQNQSAALGYDIVENGFEQVEDARLGQAMSAAAARSHDYLSIRHSLRASRLNKGLLEMDQKNAIDALKSAEAARDAACK